MKQTLVWILVAANVSLAGTLAWRGIANTTANAQVAPATPRGKYIMIPGEASTSSSIIYLFDSTNGRVGAMAPDSKDALISMPTILLKPIFDDAMNHQAAPTNGPAGNNSPPANGGYRPTRPGATPKGR